MSDIPADDPRVAGEGAVIVAMPDGAARPHRPARSRRPGEEASVHALGAAEESRCEPPSTPPAPARAQVAAWEQKAADALALLRRRLSGEYAVDEYGFDAELTENVVLPLLRPLYRHWFRVEVNGAEHIPASGGALLVANHAGGLWALDAAMTATAVHDETDRYLRMLGAELVFRTPGFGTVARRSGATLACHEDAERLLRAGELVGVWPEGFDGIGKPYRNRYQLQRFGRGGFARAAISAGVPIIPVSIVGSEEIHPVLGNVKALARVLNLPYFPLTPTFPWLGPLGLVPLPSKWHLEFGTPVLPHGQNADDKVAVFELSDRVRETIQTTLYRLLVQRRSVWH